MFKFRLGSDDTFLLLAPRGADLGAHAQIGLLALLVLMPLGLTLWLSRYELRLISRVQATGLLILRLLILAILWFVVALQPHFAEVHVEETPGRVRVAVDLSSSMDITDLQQTLSRKQIMRKVLAPDGLNLLQRLSERHQVEIVGFHRESMDLQPAQLLDKLAADNSTQEVLPTDFNLPLSKVTSSRAQPLLGIVLFSDGQHNVGVPPFDRADELGKQHVPIFPVVIGARELPNDLAILDVQAPTKVFRDADVAVEIRCKMTN